MYELKTIHGCLIFIISHRIMLERIANALKDAQAILDNKIEDSENVITQFEEYELDRLRVRYQKTRIIKGWIVIFSYLGVGLVFIVAYGLYQLLKLDEAYYD